MSSGKEPTSPGTITSHPLHRIHIGRYRQTPAADPEDLWYFYEKNSKTNETESLCLKRALAVQDSKEAAFWRLVERAIPEQTSTDTPWKWNVAVQEFGPDVKGCDESPEIESEVLLSDQEISKKWLDFETPCSDFVTRRMAAHLRDRFKLNNKPPTELLNEMREYGKACVSRHNYDAVFEYEKWWHWHLDDVVE